MASLREVMVDRLPYLDEESLTKSDDLPELLRSCQPALNAKVQRRVVGVKEKIAALQRESDEVCGMSFAQRLSSTKSSPAPDAEDAWLSVVKDNRGRELLQSLAATAKEVDQLRTCVLVNATIVRNVARSEGLVQETVAQPWFSAPIIGNLCKDAVRLANQLFDRFVPQKGPADAAPADPWPLPAAVAPADLTPTLAPAVARHLGGARLPAALVGTPAKAAPVNFMAALMSPKLGPVSAAPGPDLIRPRPPESPIDAPAPTVVPPSPIMGAWTKPLKSSSVAPPEAEATTTTTKPRSWSQISSASSAGPAASETPTKPRSWSQISAETRPRAGAVSSGASLGAWAKGKPSAAKAVPDTPLGTSPPDMSYRPSPTLSPLASPFTPPSAPTQFASPSLTASTTARKQQQPSRVRALSMPESAPLGPPAVARQPSTRHKTLHSKPSPLVSARLAKQVKPNFGGRKYSIKDLLALKPLNPFAAEFRPGWMMGLHTVEDYVAAGMVSAGGRRQDEDDGVPSPFSIAEHASMSQGGAKGGAKGGRGGKVGRGRSMSSHASISVSRMAVTA